MIEQLTKEEKIERGNAGLRDVQTTTELGKRLVDSYLDSEPIGVGEEKVIYPYGDGLVIAFIFNPKGTEGTTDVEGMKQIYYSAKLMHLLLPDNIPDVRLLGTDPPVMIVEKVTPKEFIGGYGPVGPQMALIDKAWDLDVAMDEHDPNFIMDVDGHMKYVDRFGLPKKSHRLEKAISKIKDPAKRKAAMRYAQRAGVEFYSHGRLYKGRPIR